VSRRREIVASVAGLLSGWSDAIYFHPAILIRLEDGDEKYKKLTRDLSTSFFFFPFISPGDNQLSFVCCCSTTDKKKSFRRNQKKKKKKKKPSLS